MRLFATIASIAVISISLTAKPNQAVGADYGRWSYSCMHDHKDPYGGIMTARNCWAKICGVDAPPGCLTVLYFTKKRDRVGKVEDHDGCEYSPYKMAVDGERIDQLSDDEQIAKLLSGRSLTLEVWDFNGNSEWPDCDITDQTVSLKGVSEVYKLLMKIKPKFLPGEDSSSD